MAKGKKHGFQPLWPFVIPPEARPADGEMCERLLEARRRTSALMGSHKFERLAAVHRRTETQRYEVAEELYQVRVELSHRVMLAELVQKARAAGDPAARLVSPFLAMHYMIAVQPRAGSGLQKFLRLLRTGVLNNRHTDDDLGVRHKMVRSVKETIEKVRSDPDFISKMVQCLSADISGSRETADILLQRDDGDLLALLDPDIDSESVDAALAGELAGGPLDPDGIRAASEYCRALDLSQSEFTKRLRCYSDKVSNALAYINEPIERTLTERDECPSFLLLMMFAFRMLAHRRASDMCVPLHVKQVVDTPVGARSAWTEMLEMEDLWQILAQCPETWHVVLHQILASTGGTRGEQLSGWAIPLLIDLVQHPARLNRLKAPDGAAKAKALLARHVAPCLVGFHPPMEEDALRNVQELQDMNPRHALFLFCEHIATAFQDDPDADPADQAAGPLDQRRKDVFDRAIMTFLAGNIESVLTRYCEDCGKAEEDVPDIFDLLPDLDIEEAEEEPVAEPVDRPMVWSYVLNPARPGQSTRMELPQDTRAEVLEQFFRKSRIATIVKTESIAGALEYFRNLPDASRHLAPKEVIAGQPWTKLKRGRLRILAREAENGELFFHIYPRKTWKSGMFTAPH